MSDFGPLKSGEGEDVVRHLSHAGNSMTPLADGLRAAATEASSLRIARALHHLAAEIERGRDPLEVLDDPKFRIPPHVRGLVAAATRSGRLGPVLDELMEHQRNLRMMFWGILGSLAYPLLVLLTAMVVLGFFLVYVVPQFEEMFVGMELRLPSVTVSLIDASKTIQRLVFAPERWIFLVFVVLLALLVYLAATGRGGVRLQRLLEMMPIVGPLWSWAGASGFMHLLAMMLDQNIPLDEALTLAANGMSKADLRSGGKWLADGVRSGRKLSELVETSNLLPATAVPILRWGERTGVLNQAARTLAEMFASRVAARTIWLRSASPPIVYLFVLISLGFAIMSLFMPLISLIQALS